MLLVRLMLDLLQNKSQNGQHYLSFIKRKQNSSFRPEAKHLIMMWVMKVKGPKNKADFIEVLYVVINAWGTTFANTWEYN